METGISRLNLISPLYYAPGEKTDPFSYREDMEGAAGVEELFCFELDESQFRSIEPDREKILGVLVFCGVSATDTAPKAAEGEKLLQLPRGDYLFVQKRAILSREDTAGLAVELQQEGLWQRLLPGKRLYLRYLFEDGRGVTQLFRPYSEH